jgi:hypothetical protein
MKRDLYAEVSARIIAELEAGATPWVKPWSATAGANTPCNAVSNRPYSGCNVVLLWMAANAGYRTPRYLTFKQALELGGNVRRGERGVTVFFVKRLQVADRDGEEGDTKIIPMMKAYTVFNGKHPAWAAGRLFGAVPSQLKQRGVVFMDFDELDQALNSEVGECHDAVFADPIDPYQAVLGFHVGCDVVEPVLALAEFPGDEVDRLNVRDLVDVHGQAA